MSGEGDEEGDPDNDEDLNEDEFELVKAGLLAARFGTIFEWLQVLPYPFH